MNQRKYFTSNFFINEIFSVEKFPNYGIYVYIYIYIYIYVYFYNIYTCIYHTIAAE